MHLPNIPRHVGGRKSYVQSLRYTLPVNFIYIIHEHRHLDALISLPVPSRSEGAGVRPSPASTLTINAEKNLAKSRANRSKCWRCSPIPQSLPAPLLEPLKTFGDVGHIQDRVDAVHKHSLERIALPPTDQAKYHPRLQRSSLCRADKPKLFMNMGGITACDSALWSEGSPSLSAPVRSGGLLRSTIRSLDRVACPT